MDKRKQNEHMQYLHSLFSEIKGMFDDHAKRLSRFVVKPKSSSNRSKKNGYTLDLRKDQLSLSRFHDDRESKYSYSYKSNRLLKNKQEQGPLFYDDFITLLKGIGDDLQAGKSELFEEV